MRKFVIVTKFQEQYYRRSWIAITNLFELYEVYGNLFTDKVKIIANDCFQHSNVDTIVFLNTNSILSVGLSNLLYDNMDMVVNNSRVYLDSEFITVEEALSVEPGNYLLDLTDYVELNNIGTGYAVPNWTEEDKQKLEVTLSRIFNIIDKYNLK